MNDSSSIPHSSASTIFVLRLMPHEDLKKSLQRFAADNKLKAAVIVTCVGSLEQYNLRFANQKQGHSQEGHFEILSLTGTLSGSSAHLHLSVADGQGVTRGGHLLDDNLIFTTAEIAIAELTDLAFDRIPDPGSGYAELAIRRR